MVSHLTGAESCPRSDILEKSIENEFFEKPPLQGRVV
jgi:hypothetical protein